MACQRSSSAPATRLAVETAHRATNEAGNTRAALGHVAAVRNRGGVRHVERPFHCARRCGAGPAMIDRIHQHAHAQHVGGHDEFLPLARAHLPGAGQPVDRGCPFRLRRLDFVHEAVEMLDQRLHDLPQARIGNVLPALKHHIGEVVFGHIGHGCLLESVLLELFSSNYSTVVRSCSSHESNTWVRLHKQLPALMRWTQFSVRVKRIRFINLRRVSWDLQLHVGIKRLVLWRRNAQLFCS